MRNSHLGFYPFILKSQSIFLASGGPCRQELLSSSGWRMHQCNKTWCNLNSVTHEHTASLAREQPVLPHPAQLRLFALQWPFKSMICSHISTLPSWPQLIPQRNRNTPEMTSFLGAVNCFHAQWIMLPIKSNISLAWTPMPFSQLETCQNQWGHQKVSFRLKPK